MEVTNRSLLLSGSVQLAGLDHPLLFMGQCAFNFIYLFFLNQQTNKQRKEKKQIWLS